MKVRDKSIDMLRFIGMVGVLIAHVNPSDLWLQIRNFDVPLMAIVMGMSYYVSSKGKVDYLPYIKKRIGQLIKPTWIFLTVFFIITFSASIFLNVNYPITINGVVMSYLLLDGIGYVWIIGVFLSVALLNPLILKLSNAIESNFKYYMILLVTFICYLPLTLILNYLGGIPALLYEQVFLYTIAYGLMSAIGMRVKQTNTKEKYIIILISLLTYIAIGLSNNFASTNIAKYPPTTYYLAYAIGVSFALILLLDNHSISRLFDNKLVYFISQNSIWFYLWHILFVYMADYVVMFVPILNSHWFFRFIYLFIGALITTYIHKFILDKLNHNVR